MSRRRCGNTLRRTEKKRRRKTHACSSAKKHSHLLYVHAPSPLPPPLLPPLSISPSSSSSLRYMRGAFMCVAVPLSVCALHNKTFLLFFLLTEAEGICLISSPNRWPPLLLSFTPPLLLSSSPSLLLSSSPSLLLSPSPSFLLSSVLYSGVHSDIPN